MEYHYAFQEQDLLLIMEGSDRKVFKIYLSL